MNKMEIEENVNKKLKKNNSKNENKSENNDKLMWVEKYRPKKLDDLLSHEQVIGTITKLVDSNKLPHLLFYGPPGTGKTTTIKAIAQKIYGEKFASKYTFELNASDERGIDVVRNKIKSFAETQDLFRKHFKLIILDEADHMTKIAQAALRRTIEQYTKNTRFCLICNYVNKLIPAIQSRCMRFRFGPLSKKVVIPRLKQISQLEKLKVEESALKAIYKLSNGDMRKCIHVLQSAHLMTQSDKNNIITEKEVYVCAGKPRKEDIHEITTLLFNASFKEAFTGITKIKEERGLALQDILTEIYNSYIFHFKHLTEESKIFLLEKLSDIQYRSSFGTNEKLQLSSLISSFIIIRESLSSKKSPLEIEEELNLVLE